MTIARATVLAGFALACAPGGARCSAATSISIASFPGFGTDTLVADGTTVYTLTTTVSSPKGYDDIACVRALFNYTESGGNSAYGRGYLAWALTDASISRYGGTWAFADATGGGRWAYRTDDWGKAGYMLALSCAVTNTGSASGASGARTIAWSIRAKSAWALNPIGNDADVWAQDAADAYTGWRDNPNSFDVVVSACTSVAGAPAAPTVSNPTAHTVDVSVNPADPALDRCCIRVSPATDDKSYVQQDGSLGGFGVWLPAQTWGTVTVRGLDSSIAYTLQSRATRAGPGGCPSGFGPVAALQTAADTIAINTGPTGSLLHRGVIGNATRLDIYPTGGLIVEKTWDVLRNTLARGIAGGLDADTYNWKDMSGEGVGHSGTPAPSVPTTLDWMRRVRDYQAVPLVAVNTRGTGPLESSGWCTFYYTNTAFSTLTKLAGDWVRYINFILPAYRQGDTLPVYDQLIVDSINWYGKPRLLSPGEASTPKVTYWEIGNEPEVPMPFCTPSQPGVSLTPSDYAARYKAITNAMRAVDSSIRVGPCITTANNGNQWLAAVLSDPANRVDFVGYHPYGPLYAAAQAGDTIANAHTGLTQVRPQLVATTQKVRELITASGRDGSALPLIASEWNASDWHWECSTPIRRVSHALGVADTLLTMGEMGLLGANYWSWPAWCGDGTETPGYKVFEKMQECWGDLFLGSYSDNYDIHTYTAWKSDTQELVIWALNFSETNDKPINIHLPGIGAVERLTLARLANLSGPTSLFDRNDPPYTSAPKVDWTTTDLTGTVDPSDFGLTLPHATISVITIRRVLRGLPDGMPVALKSRAVSAAFADEGYLYVSQDDRSFGIRVEGAFAGISPGDRVDVTGVMSTRKPDGTTPAERMIQASSVVRVSPGDPVMPLGMNCRTVGGGPLGDIPGVAGGSGLQNIGSLARVTGRVRLVIGPEIYIEDGSVSDSALTGAGVTVRCPGVPPVSPGQLVTVSGVIEGNLSDGTAQNRRFMRARDLADIIVQEE